MNYWLLLGPIGMILIGALSIIYWLRKHKSKPMLLAWGGLLWLIAILLKSVMDYTIMTQFYTFINDTIPSMLLLIVSIIVGARTGFFESGISYLMLKGRLGKAKWNDAIAVGIGFGAAEAIMLGALSLTSMLIIMDPAFISTLTSAEQALLDAQLSQNTIIILASWLERFFTLLAHVFATVLVIKPINSKKTSYLWVSILYKSLLDAPVPLLQTFISDSLVNTLLAESYIVLMGLIGLYGLKWLGKQKSF